MVAVDTYIIAKSREWESIHKNCVHPELFNYTSHHNEPSLRISHKGAVSTLHYDSSDSFLIQAKGQKKMILFPNTPNNLKYTYPKNHILSRRFLVNLDNYQQKLYPDFNIDDAISVTINEGDCLYFPYHWGHYTISLDDCISIGFRNKKLSKNKNFTTISTSEINSIEQAQYPNYSQIW